MTCETKLLFECCRVILETVSLILNSMRYFSFTGTYNVTCLLNDMRRSHFASDKIWLSDSLLHFSTRTEHQILSWSRHELTLLCRLLQQVLYLYQYARISFDDLYISSSVWETLIRIHFLVTRGQSPFHIIVVDKWFHSYIGIKLKSLAQLSFTLQILL